MPTTHAADADPTASDYETVERRYTLAVTLESWELLAMHSIAGDESIPRVRLKLMKELCGISERTPAAPMGNGKRRRVHGG